MSIEAPFIFLADTDMVLTLMEYNESHKGVAASAVRSLHE
jgi:hypothetical protein